MSETVRIAMPGGGGCDARLFEPEGEEPRPGLIFFMDGLGPRETLFAMARRFASFGYVVLLPDLYYRSAPYEPISLEAMKNDPGARERFGVLLASVDNRNAAEDVAAYAGWLSDHPRVAGGLNAVGYCFGGRFALLAAARPGMRAVASIHGASLVSDAADSPHRAVSAGSAAAYVGTAGIDPHFPPEAVAQLALDWHKGGIGHVIENHAGVAHGFAVADLPAFDDRTAERHWQTLERFLERAALQ